MTLQANALTFRIPSGHALVDSVDVSVEAGEILAMLGPNGAGKSTLLKMLSGELRPTSGDVYIGGKSVYTLDASERAKRTAILPQNSTLAFPFPVLDVVLMGRIPHRKNSSHRRDHAVAWESLRAMEAEHLAERSYPTLSGGEKQRVQLARILAQLEDGDDLTGKALLLDEPTSALDLSHQHQVLGIARRVAARGAAVLAILHDLNLAAQYADRLQVLHGGKSVAEGDPSMVLKPCTIDQVYGVTAVIHHNPASKCPFISTIAREEVRAAVS